ncbi:MAG: c-type cytochrome domain-containing protein [Gammaproteobacteria bacterium]
MDFIFFLGRLHVLVLHLPIGIIVALFVLEWLSRKEKYRYLQVAAPFLWGAMGLTAVATVVLGYLHFSEGSFSGLSADQHRFFGTVTAVVAAGVALLRVGSFAESYKPLFFPSASVLLVLISITGHYGGNLTHGSTYLVEYAPQPLRSLAGLAPKRKLTSVREADPFVDVVGPILREHCQGCHNEDKKENSLVLTTYAGVMRGGESGKVVVAGNTELSELLRRISLDPADDEFMPAEGKPPLSAQQRDIIRWWIAAGTKNGGTVGDLEVPPEIEKALSAELGVSF